MSYTLLIIQVYGVRRVYIVKFADLANTMLGGAKGEQHIAHLITHWLCSLLLHPLSL